MANHLSAKKRQRQTEKRRIRNTAVRSALKSSIKQLRESVAKGDQEAAGTKLKSTCSELDRAVSKGVMHRNSASRRISRLNIAVSNMGAK